MALHGLSSSSVMFGGNEGHENNGVNFEAEAVDQVLRETLTDKWCIIPLLFLVCEVAQ